MPVRSEHNLSGDDTQPIITRMQRRVTTEEKVEDIAKDYGTSVSEVYRIYHNFRYNNRCHPKKPPGRPKLYGRHIRNSILKY